ncbi:MAG: RHS repeat-associated core domain-containing protein [Planctomycetota bacterium]
MNEHFLGINCTQNSGTPLHLDCDLGMNVGDTACGSAGEIICTELPPEPPFIDCDGNGTPDCLFEGGTLAPDCLAVLRVLLDAFEADVAAAIGNGDRLNPDDQEAYDEAIAQYYYHARYYDFDGDGTPFRFDLVIALNNQLPGAAAKDENGVNDPGGLRTEFRSIFDENGLIRRLDKNDYNDNEENDNSWEEHFVGLNPNAQMPMHGALVANRMNQISKWFNSVSKAELENVLGYSLKGFGGTAAISQSNIDPSLLKVAFDNAGYSTPDGNGNVPLATLSEIKVAIFGLAETVSAGGAGAGSTSNLALNLGILDSLGNPLSTNSAETNLADRLLLNRLNETVLGLLNAIAQAGYLSNFPRDGATTSWKAAHKNNPMLIEAERLLRLSIIALRNQAGVIDNLELRLRTLENQGGPANFVSDRLSTVAEVPPGTIVPIVFELPYFSAWSWTFWVGGTPGVAADVAADSDDGMGNPTPVVSVDLAHEYAVEEDNVNEEGDPVDTWTGQLRRTDIDYASSARGVGVSIERVYLSQQGRSGSFGPNWSAPGFDTYLFIPSNHVLSQMATMKWGDGRTSTFMGQLPGPGHDVLYEGVLGEYGKIRAHKASMEPGCSDMPGSYVLRRPNGSMFFFCPGVLYPNSGAGKVCWLRKIVDPDGNAIVYQRNEVGRVTSIIDPLGRTTPIDYGDNGFVSQITTPSGQVITYEYDERGFSETEDGSLYVPNDLTRVEYGSIPVLGDDGVVASHDSAITYEYSFEGQVAGSFPYSPLNHNLKSVQWDGDLGPVVEFSYEDDRNSLSFDFVTGFTEGSRSTTISWIINEAPVADDYGEDIRKECVFRNQDGEILHCFHNKFGLLVRRETHTALDADQNFVPDLTVGPNDQHLVERLRYDTSDSRIVERIVGEADDVSQGSGVSKETYEYDSDSADRFQQANLLRHEVFPTATDNGESPSLLVEMEYEPVGNSMRKTTDPLGNVEETFFLWQEVHQSSIALAFGIAGWGIDFSQTSGGMGDINGDGEAGALATIDQIPILGVGPIKIVGSPVTIADGPGLTPSVDSPINTHEYDSLGRLKASVNAAGVRVEYEYFQGHLSAVVLDPDDKNQRTEFVYDAISGRRLSMTRPDGVMEEYSYDDLGTLIQRRIVPDTAHPDYSSAQHPVLIQNRFYDHHRNLVGRGTWSSAVPSGEQQVGFQPSLTMRATHDRWGNVSKLDRTTEYEGVVEMSSRLFEYDGASRRKRTVQPDGVIYEVTFDGLGRPVNTVHTDSAGVVLKTMDFEFDVWGNIVAERGPVDADHDGLPDLVSAIYDGYGRVAKIIAPDGGYSSYVYDGLGRRTHNYRFNSNNEMFGDASFGYDSMGRVLAVDETIFEVSAVAGNAPVAVDIRRREMHWGLEEDELRWAVGAAGTPAEAITRLEYDSLGRHVGQWIEGHQTSKSTVAYDQFGREVSVTTRHANSHSAVGLNAGIKTSAFTLDPYGRVVLITGSDGRTTAQRWDQNGRMYEVVDPNGVVSKSVYDSLGQVRQRIDDFGGANERVEEFDFNALGQMTIFRDANGQETQFTHDEFGHIKSRTFPDGKGEIYSYDARGRIVQKSGFGDAAQSTTSFDYDVIGRLQELVAVGADADVTRTFVYGPSGLAITVEEQVGGLMPVRISQVFRSDGGLLSEIRHVDGVLAATVGAKLDIVGRTEQVFWADSSSVKLVHDELGRVIRRQLFDPMNNPGVILEDHSAFYGTGRPLRSTIGNGSQIEVDVSDQGKTARRGILDSAGSSARTFSYQHDPSGNTALRTREEDQQQEEFEYDSLDRLKVWRINGSSGGTPFSLAFEWDMDDADNPTEERLLNGAVVNTVVNNNLNQQTSNGPMLSEFNGRGEMEARVKDDILVQWKWDALGRPLTAEVVPSDGSWKPVEVAWLYDGLGRVVEKAGIGVDPVGYVYLGGAMVASNFNGVERRFVHCDFGIYRDGPEGAYYLHQDAANNVTLIQDGAGSTAEEVAYTPFGQPIDAMSLSAKSSSVISNELLFLGHQYDYFTRTSKLGARRYEPRVGRFVSRDPLGESAGRNLYQYGNRNPLRWMDPSGLQSTDIESPTDKKLLLSNLTKTPLGVRDRGGVKNWVKIIRFLRKYAGGFNPDEIPDHDSFWTYSIKQKAYLIAFLSTNGNRFWGGFREQLDLMERAVLSDLEDTEVMLLSKEGIALAILDHEAMQLTVILEGGTPDPISFQSANAGDIAITLASEAALFFIPMGGRLLRGTMSFFGKYVTTAVGRSIGSVGRVFAKAFRAAKKALNKGDDAARRGDWAELSGKLREAGKGKGNFGIGYGTREQAGAMGEAWVGPGFKTASDGKTLISADGLRQFRPPSFKPRQNRFQANFEARPPGLTQWQSNAHLDIIN